MGDMGDMGGMGDMGDMGEDELSDAVRDDTFEAGIALLGH
jgi:hypothetical protein